ncbi:MAG: SpoIID/LytB domain-containing protein [Spirochaetaceae bacterium]|nr:MAG: SpoIID/LytB domain-containing protein [Spirochaetaceae bacterium]
MIKPTKRLPRRLMFFGAGLVLAGSGLVATPPLFAAGAQRETLGNADGADASSITSEPLTVEKAVARYAAGDIETAIAGLEAQLVDAPDDTAARHNLALLLREAGRMTDAIAVLRAEPELAGELATTLVLAGRPDDAIAVFEAVDLNEAELSGASTAATVTAFWHAVALFDQERWDESDAAFVHAISLREHLPLAYQFRGRIALEQNDPARAVTLLERALRQDANLTASLVPLAQAHRALGRPEQAYGLLSRAVIARPWDRGAAEMRAALEAEHPELVTDREAEVARRIVTASPPRVVPVPTEIAADAPLVRIGLAENVTTLSLKSGGDFTVVDQDGVVVATGGRDTVLTVSAEPGLLALSGGDVSYQGTGPLEIRYDDPAATTMLFDLEYGHGQFSAGREDRSYRGVIRLLSRPDRGATVVNVLDVESYLLSVVPSEMPALWPEAALEAQAVAARSYTLAPRPRFHPRGFDLLASVTSAFYRGVGGEHPRTTAAVLQTAGMVLTHGENALDAVYSANSAGYTEGAESVWGFASPLVGVSDPLLPSRESLPPPADLEAWLADRPTSHSNHERFSSFAAYRWSLWVSVEELAQRLAHPSIGRITALVTRGRGASGRVEAVEVVGTEGSVRVERDLIRSRLGGLRSNLFSVSPRLGTDGLPTHFVFSGAGWGHGVGMCQSGAAGMASAGFTAEEILGHYYPQAPLERWY